MKKMTLSGTRLLVLLIFAPMLRVPAADLHVPTQYPTISNAVKAARSGDTIRIAPGDYYEQFVIVSRTNLTLQGEPGTVLHATAEMEQTLLPHDGLAYTIAGVVRRSDVTFRGLEFQGHRLGNNYETPVSGVVFRGASGRIESCQLRGFRGNRQSRAVNVENHFSDSSTISNIEIYKSTFADNRLSVVLRGTGDNRNLLRTVFALEDNIFTGSGPTATEDYSVGVYIAEGAGGEVRGNRFTDHIYTGSDGVGNGIEAASRFEGEDAFYRLRPVKYIANTFSNNNVHLHTLAANESQIINNVFDRTAPGAPPFEHAVALSGTNIVVANNNFVSALQGIWLYGDELLWDIYQSGRAVNVKLTNNWFTNVTTPIQKNELVTGLVENGTATCCFQPSFLSITNLPVDGSVAFSVRVWHAKPTVLEVSSDLRQWSPALTNSFPLPISEFEKPVPDSAQQFYRLRDLQ